MLVKFIYHSPPVFLLHLPELRRVYLPLGGRKGGGGGCKGRKGGVLRAEPEGTENYSFRCTYLHVCETVHMCV